MLTVGLLTQCSAPVSVRTVNPSAPVGMTIAASTTDALLGAVRDAYERLRRGDESARAGYNYAIARLVEGLERSGADPWSRSLPVSGLAGIRSLEGRAPKGVAPLHDQLIPADTLEFRGEDATHRSTVAGLGAPLVMIASLAHLGHEEIRKKMPLRNLTAVVRFDGPAATLELLDPYQVEMVTLAGRRHPLAADYGAAVMFGMSKARVDKLGIERLLRPSRYGDTVQLNFLQPYDPERIPILLVHGLDSTPATFAPMYFELLKDAEIRKRYQFWVFSYPSGYPYPYPAMLLRRELDEVAAAFPGRRDLVIIGHSMGSLISRLMVTDVGDTIWRAAFGKPVEETPIHGRSREILIGSVVFRNRPEIHRAIFISGPHRGSELASNWIGRTGSKLVRLPGTMANVRDSVVSAATADTAAKHLNRTPNSIDTLSPDNPFVLEINKIPIAPGVTYHSIMGDRGKGDTPDSSDGVVPYWSSHLDGAASEKIVPSGHGAHRHPEGIAEVRRILLLHLKQH